MVKFVLYTHFVYCENINSKVILKIKKGAYIINNATFRGTMDGNQSSQINPNHSNNHGYYGHTHSHSHVIRNNMGFDDRISMSDPLYQKCNRGSHSSDTSSAYSGSDTMMSVHSNSLDTDEVDLSGLVESVVDSDEEDLVEGMDSLMVRDTVRECLEKDPSDRTEEDIEILLEFTQKLRAFTNMTLAVRKALCSVMVFAVVEKAGTMVMNDGEELDSWSVLINGHVEIEHVNGEKEELQIGDSFGILPTMDKLYHRGIMRTKCDDCQFVCITQTDYYRIQHQGEENIRKHEDETGTCVMVTEARSGANESCNRKGYVVIRGTPEKLISQLIEENSISDPTYIEDFLLTHRTFINNPMVLVTKLLDWFENFEDQDTDCGIDIRDRVTRVVLLWVENHFTDFECDSHMMDFLEKFELLLEEKSMVDQLSLFHIKCSAKAKIRTVTLARSSRDENLNFKIIGGYYRDYSGIYIVSVERGTKAEDVGLKRGDQILEVNGQNFEHVPHKRAMELLTGTTHLCITVKNNLLGFKEILHSDSSSVSSSSTSSSQRSRQLRQKKVLSDQQSKISRLSSHDLGISSTDSVDHSAPIKKESNANIPTPQKSSGFMTLVPKKRLQKALIRMNLLPKNNAILDQISVSSSSSTNDEESNLLTTSNFAIDSNTPSTLYHSHSNPDLTSVLYYEDPRSSDYPEHVLKVYKSDQTCKYLLVHKETTSHEVVMLALREFGIIDPSSNFSLCEVSVGEGGMIKQRRLPEQLQNLAERIGLSSRYYLKTNGITETLVPDDMAPDLIRESSVHFLQLNANEIAIQLTLQDFSVFRQIESIEYIDDLFNLESKYGTPMLKKFAELVNKEMFWVVTEVCQEHNIVRRMKIIKQFIKIARHCKECKNFNSLFAIISGLGHVAVSRLRLTWEKLPSKYQKLFSDLQDLMDPSRNMSKYRQLVTAELLTQQPLIPFYPVVKKDLTFIHLGNDTKIDNLINFEKLRMISKEIRNLIHMCSTPYDLLTTLELRGQPPSSAMVALNQMSVSTTHSSNTHHISGSTVKRRKKSTAAPNPKKMFEEAQMVRRVKAYLNNIKIVTDEDLLQQYSIECEPSTTSTGALSSSIPNSVSIRKRYPSPTLSTTSSTSSNSEGKKTGPKFGKYILEILINNKNKANSICWGILRHTLKITICCFTKTIF